MVDRESVITHLQIIHTWAEFARERDLQFFTVKHLEDIAKWSDDAIELLKEQDTVEHACDILRANGWKETEPLCSECDAVHVVMCKDCTWWERKNESSYGYCNACKHGYHSSNWEIGIYRLYKEDFFCADGERKDS